MTDVLRARHVHDTHVHFGDGGGAYAIDVTPSFWPDLMSGKLRELEQGRLMTYGEFAKDWDSWEMHPNGDELVLLLSGSVTFVLELDGKEHELLLNTTGAFAIIPRGTWHTARTQTACTMLFITPGQGTQHRS
ncbi:MAG TPA: cupin domain-containing protein [Polyangiaceae bacterium]